MAYVSARINCTPEGNKSTSTGIMDSGANIKTDLNKLLSNKSTRSKHPESSIFFYEHIGSIPGIHMLPIRAEAWLLGMVALAVVVFIAMFAMCGGPLNHSISVSIVE